MSVKWGSFSLNENIASTSATSRDLIYSATNGVAEINKATVRNTSNTDARDVSFCILSDTTATGTVQVLDTVTVGTESTVNLTNLVSHRVPSGGSIQMFVDAGSDCYVTISGDERQQ